MSKDGDEQIDGFDCECGERHEYPPYVAAHYDEPLLHTCKKCGRKHNIFRGKARLVEGNTLADALRSA
jgi:hypothetical protein